MSQLLIPDLDDAILARLRERATRPGRTVETEAKTILSLAVPANSTSQLAVNGQTLQESAEPISEWSDAKNHRRCELIDREIDDNLTADERIELEDLQEQMLRYRHRVAPLPLAQAQRILDELERKAAAAK